jgi:hypothetical protein
MNNFGHRAKHLVREMIPPALFFFVAFQLLAFTRALMLNRYGIEVATFAAATIGALVVAKVVVLTNLLPFINRFPSRPLLWNIGWKTPIYFAAALVVRYIEEFVHFYRQHGDIMIANRHLLDEVIWTRFWAIQIWLMVLLLVYCTLSELVRVSGWTRVRELFIGASGKAATDSNPTSKNFIA